MSALTARPVEQRDRIFNLVGHRQSSDKKRHPASAVVQTAPDRPRGRIEEQDQVFRVVIVTAYRELRVRCEHHICDDDAGAVALQFLLPPKQLARPHFQERNRVMLLISGFHNFVDQDAHRYRPGPKSDGHVIHTTIRTIFIQDEIAVLQRDAPRPPGVRPEFRHAGGISVVCVVDEGEDVLDELRTDAVQHGVARARFRGQYARPRGNDSGTHAAARASSAWCQRQCGVRSSVAPSSLAEASFAALAGAGRSAIPAQEL
mmetsp:Transcript_23477/g.70377  ORF Transcript_23477/g.70377 Transcript_23477/m.70377 type:complete len:260 (+) Transcript_23477:662-1441(+)